MPINVIPTMIRKDHELHMEIVLGQLVDQDPSYYYSPNLNYSPNINYPGGYIGGIRPEMEGVKDV